MGRKKGYEREALVAKAMAVFQGRGFRGASTEVLVRELGVNRNSVYSEFGSKEGLFVAALGHYEERVVEALFGPLESSAANLDDIEALFRTFSRSAAGARRLGCLMCNTATELGGAEPGLQPRVERYFARLQAAFGNALRGAIRRDQLPASTDVLTAARFLTSSCLGIFVMARAGIAASVARGAAEGALEHLRLLRRVQSRRQTPRAS